MLAPRAFSQPKARNPSEAVQLYKHKIAKRYPFVMVGYDREAMEDYRVWGINVRPGNEPEVKGITADNSYFFLHSQNSAHEYTFIHMIADSGNIHFRALMFTDFAEAYRYALAYGCKINKKPDITMGILDYMAEAMDDVDMFVERISIKGAIRDMRPRPAIIRDIHLANKPVKT